MKHLFLDTNVIIDILADRPPFAEVVSKLLDQGEKGKISIYISALSYSNIYYILSKSNSHKEIISLLKNLQEITTTIEVSSSTIQTALDSELKDFEDSIQLQSALSHKKIQAIVTRDPKGFKTSELPVLTPDEALRIIETAGR